MSHTERAWQELFADLSEPYWDALLRFAFGLCHARAEADDLLQEALVKGVRHFAAFTRKALPGADPAAARAAFCAQGPEHAHFRNWLYVILRHAHADRWKLQNRRNESPLDAENEPEGAPLGADPIAPEAFLQEAEDRFYAEASDDALLSHMGALNPRQRSILFLVAEGYTYKEAAELLGIPIGSVMSGLSRGLARIRSSMRGGGKALKPGEGIE